VTARPRRPGNGGRELFLASPQLALDALDHRLRRHVAFADADVQAFEVGVVELLGDLREDRRTEELLRGQRLAPHRLDEIVTALVDRVDATFAREPLTDLRAGARRLDELRPVSARTRAFDLAREDLARVPRLQRRVERHQPGVDPRTDTSMADLGVDRV